MAYIKRINEYFNDESENTQIEYITGVVEALVAFKKAFNDLSSKWGQDKDNDMDMNEFLKKDYPFKIGDQGISFDEININSWVENSIGRLNQKASDIADVKMGRSE
jgi:hypothetical protein